MRKIIVLLLILLVLAAGALLIHHQQPVAVSGSGCVDIPASPDYLSTNKEADAIAAIDNAHAQEDLPPLRLPANYYRLEPPQQQFILLNLERTDRGLQPLEMDATLSQMALGYSRQLFNLHFFSHTSPISGTFTDRMENNPATALQYSLAAENLAGNPVAGAGPIYEYMYDDSAESCGHRLNILDPKLTLVGINWVRGGQYGSISAQEFLASAGWNLHSHPPPDTIAPYVVTGQPLLEGSNLSCRTLVGDNVGVVRITWFLDRFGNQPYLGPTLTLDVSHLSPGRHTLVVYVVDGALNYSMASCTFIVKP
ncbi:MAG TPA: CAP domain-containing protein [Ktedonobacteraceae bacterium]|nr:CAP domain-containing protein [Ktedonobacteraceae bacterium]